MRVLRIRARSRTAFGAAVVVIGGAGVGVAFASGLVLHDSSTPASVRDAVSAFRSSVPAPSGPEGVYAYTTRGYESLRVVVRARHDYPAVTAMTAVRTGCGLAVTWRPLVERSTTWVLCRGRAGRSLVESSESHRFFGTRDTVDYRCDVVFGAGVASRASCRSREDGERLVVRRVGREAVRVGEVGIPAVRYRTVGRVSGHDGGVETVDWWFAPALDVPVRIDLRSDTSRGVTLGRARYAEDVTLTLASPTPRR